MTLILFFEQLLNGVQLGVMLFLTAAGLTLVLGIMNFVNLAHGSLYMVGAYLTVAAYQWTGSYALGVLLGLAGTLLVGMLVEVLTLRPLDGRPEKVKLDKVKFPDRTGTLNAIANVLDKGIVPRGFSSGEDNLGSLALVQATILSASRGGDWVDMKEILGWAASHGCQSPIRPG